MPRLSWQEYDSWINRQGNSIGELVKDAAQGVCGLYRQYPKFFTGNLGIVTLPPSQLAKGVWDVLCNQDGGNPAPEQPFEGGQCPIQYDISWDATGTIFPCAGSPFPPSNISQQTGSYLGPITSISPKVVQEGNCGPTQYDMEIVWDGGSQTTLVSIFSTSTNFRYEVTVSNIQVVPALAGQTDNCGSVSPDWPPELSNDPPPGVLNPTLPIPGNGGLNVTIPVVYAPITPTLEIPLKIGPFDFNFDLGGLTFNFNLNEAGDIINLPPGDDSPSDLLPPPPAPEIPEINDKLDDLLDDNRRDPVNRPAPSPDDYDIQDRDPQDPKEQKGINIDFVLITLSRLPIERKIQSGEGSPNVCYAGWFEWLIGDDALPREPIHFERSLFSKPLQAVDGYAYTLTNGSEGSAKEFSLKLPPEQ